MESIKPVAATTTISSIATETSTASKNVSSLPAFSTEQGTISLNSPKATAISGTEIESMLQRGEAGIKEAFNVERSTFYVMELPDGRLFTRVRNLDTGEVKYFPAMDPFSYNQAVNADRGIILQKDV